jgi:hypothetical protein
MLHYAYSKTPTGPRWTVEDAKTTYHGSRVLDDYAGEAVEYVRMLERMLSDVEIVLRNSARTT